MPDLPQSAEALARRLHAGQVDKGGRPYVEHLAAVVAILLRRWPDAPEEAVAAAWLHDALEDTEVDVNQLEFEAIGIDWQTLDLALEVCRCAWQIYEGYIGLLAFQGSLWAIRIKLADLEHNCDPARPLPGSDLVERRYRPAIAVLETALARREGRHG